MSPIQYDLHTPVDKNRDSAFVTDSPIPPHGGFIDHHEPVRDSAVHLRDESPSLRIADAAIASLTWSEVDEERETVDLRSEITEHGDHHHSPSSPSVQSDGSRRRTYSPTSQTQTDLHQSQTNHRSRSPRSPRSLGSERVHPPPLSYPPKHENIVRQRVQGFETRGLHHPHQIDHSHLSDPSSSERTKDQDVQNTEPLKKSRIGKVNEPLPGPITPPDLSFAARRSSHELRSDSAQSQRSISNPNIIRLRTPESSHSHSHRDRVRPGSSNGSRASCGRSGTPPLRRSDRRISGDLRSLSQRTSKHDLAKEAELALLTSAAAASSIANTATPTANEGRVRAKDMADVYVSRPDYFIPILCVVAQKLIFVCRMALVKVALDRRSHRHVPTACAADKACKFSTSKPKSSN